MYTTGCLKRNLVTWLHACSPWLSPAVAWSWTDLLQNLVQRNDMVVYHIHCCRPCEVSGTMKGQLTNSVFYALHYFYAPRLNPLSDEIWYVFKRIEHMVHILMWLGNGKFYLYLYVTVTPVTIGQLEDYPSAIRTTLENMGKCIKWICYELMYVMITDQNTTKSWRYFPNQFQIQFKWMTITHTI